MSEYGVGTSRRNLYGAELSNEQRNKRNIKGNNERQESANEAWKWTKRDDDVVFGEHEDKYYQYLLKKSSLNRGSPTTEAATGGVQHTSSHAEQNSSAKRGQYLANKPPQNQTSRGQRQTNHEPFAYQGEGHSYPNSREKTLNHANLPSASNNVLIVDYETKSNDSQSGSEDGIERRPRVRDLRSIFDSRNGKDETGGIVYINSQTRNVDQAMPATSNMLHSNKDPIKTNERNQSFPQNKVHDVAPAPSRVEKTRAATVESEFKPSKPDDINYPSERERVFSDPGNRKPGVGGRLHAGAGGQLMPAFKTPIRLSKEEVERAHRLSLSLKTAKAAENTTDDDDESSGSETESENLDESHPQVSDEQVLKMLHKFHPTGELKKMFDGPDAFNATTKRQSFYERYETATGLSDSEEINGHDEELAVEKDLPGKYVASGPETDNGIPTKSDIDVCRFVSDSPVSVQITKVREQHVESSPELTKDEEALNYKSMYKDFLMKEGFERPDTPSPPPPDSGESAKSSSFPAKPVPEPVLQAKQASGTHSAPPPVKPVPDLVKPVPAAPKTRLPPSEKPVPDLVKLAKDGSETRSLLPAKPVPEPVKPVRDASEISSAPPAKPVSEPIEQPRETLEARSPPKQTFKYQREQYRRPLYSEDSEDSEILGDTDEKAPFPAMPKVNDVIEKDETLEVNEEPSDRLNNVDSSTFDDGAFINLMPQEYDDDDDDEDEDNAQEENIHEDSSSALDESDIGSLNSSQGKSGFAFNFVLKHEDDLKATVEPPKLDEVGLKDKKRGVKFSDGPHTVHETYHPLDYERGNDDIDPVSSSAEWELEKRVEKMDIFSVDLDKGDQRGLGLSIVGLGVGTDSGVEKLGIFVKSLTVGGAAEADSRIQVNDQILEVDGISLVGVSQLFAAQTLKNTKGTVRFLMGREKGQHNVVKAETDKYRRKCEKLEDELKKAKAYIRELEAEHVVDKVTAESGDEGLQRQVKVLQDKLSRSQESLVVAEREHQALLQQLDESKKLYSMVQKRNSVLKENLEKKPTSEESELAHCNDQLIERLQARIRELESATAASHAKVVKASSAADDSNIFEQYLTPTHSLNDVQSERDSDDDDDDAGNNLAARQSDKTSELNDIPATTILDNRMQLDKRQVSVESRRRLPSQELIHNFGSNFHPDQEAEYMNKSVEDLVEKVRQYATDEDEPDPVSAAKTKQQRPQTGYYTKPLDLEASARVRPLHKTTNDREKIMKDVLTNQNSLSSIEGDRGSRETAGDTRVSEERSTRQQELAKQEAKPREKSPAPSPPGEENADKTRAISPSSSTGMSEHSSAGVGSSGSLPEETGAKPVMMAEWKNIPLTEWDKEQVSCWLMSIELEEYSGVFTSNTIDGNELLAMDNNKMKALGVQQKHQKLLKKRIKDLKTEMEKQEKQRGKGKKGKKVPFWKGKYNVSQQQ